MNPDQLTAALKEKALALGFDKVAIANAAPLERDRAALAAWLAADRHATMAWMKKGSEKRSDPSSLLPGCRAVVSVAMNYKEGTASESHPNSRRGRVARYAQGRDYHRVIGEKLKDLAAWLSQTSGQPARTFVDTGPVLERAWAERSGLGWIGKNANLLTRDMGSWLLLGELLTAAELAHDAGPHQEFCGTCTACLDACPTQAIVDPGVVDAQRCISYWTIEHRGSIPADKREGLADWIFGCDVCQDVCPWNISFSKPAATGLFKRRDDLDGLDPEEILAMDEATFRKRYSGTPLMRAKWEGMRRNACIALGNRKDFEALPGLRRAIEDDDPVVREHAQWAIERIEGKG
ncbi:MAG TPA: tRNA epoxyqueuosine(34) reductase QueG [Candidatus Polarisedimenticolaceae bacterium]|nr:tRNA epoxyqueuosine(34) reductase QueG [Candidatus Polarisedimenticolaceae bacterium]